MNITGFSILAKTTSTFARNWSLLTLSDILCQVLGMISTIRIARVLAPEGFGFLGMVQVNAGIGVVMASLGLRQVITRECARHPEKSLSLFKSSAILQAVLFIPVGAGLLFYSVWLSENLSLSLGWVSLLLFFGMLSWQLVESLAFGYERMEFSSILNFVGSLLWVIFAWATPAVFMTTTVVCLVFALLQVLKSGSYLLGVIKVGLIRGAKNAVTIKLLLQKGLPFYWLAILTAACNQLPILFLAERSGAVEVGLYSAGMKLSRPMQMMIQTLMLSLYPGFSKMSQTDPARYRLLVQRSLLALVISGSVLASCITVFRVEFVTLVFGIDFQRAANTIILQIWYFSFLCIFNFIGMTLAATDRQNWLAKLATLYATIAVPLLWVGSAYGATGLAAAMLFAAIVNMSYHWFVFQKSFSRPLPLDYSLTLFGVPLLLALVTYRLSPDLCLLWRTLGYLVLLVLFAPLVWNQASKLKIVST